MGKKDTKTVPSSQTVNVFKKLSFITTEADLLQYSLQYPTNSGISSQDDALSIDKNHQKATESEKKLEFSSKANENDVQTEESNAAIDVRNVIKPPKPTKKYQNIPICEVTGDETYDARIQPNYEQPNTYIRRTKRIDDENDVIADYCLEDEDITWLKSFLLSVQKDTDYSEFYKDPSSNVLEILFNIFERNTGLNREPIPLTLAQKLTASKFEISPLLASKVVSPAYYHWCRRREKLQKPLSRKYWPQTQSNDMNPHHVFRARDKERYRLRKQHRKNDVESFRKMQHLRREFDKAQLLLQYVLEREYLNQAAFDIDQEIFEQKIFDLTEPIASNSSASNESSSDQPATDDSTVVVGVKRRRETPYRYSIQCKELVLTSTDDLANDPYGSLQTYQPITKRESKYSTSAQQRSDRFATGSMKYNFDSTSIRKSNILRPNSVSSVNGAYQNALEAGSQGEGNIPEDISLDTLKLPPSGSTVNTENKQIRKRRSTVSSSSQSTGRGRYHGMDSDYRVHGTVVENPSALQPTAANIVDVGAYHNDVTSLKIPDVTSSLGRLYQWATNQVTTFMDPLSIREKVPSTSSFISAADYVKDLELRSSDQTNVAMNSGYIGLAPIYPITYRNRGRIGRGGRLVVDRIPIYDQPIDTLAQTNNTVRHMLGTHSYTTTGTSSSDTYMPTSHHYIQPTSIPVMSRYTTAAMLQGHGQATKRFIHRNITTNSSVIDGNIYYTATASANASMNTATGVTASAYGFASAMPISFQVNQLPSSIVGGNGSDEMKMITSSGTQSSSQSQSSIPNPIASPSPSISAFTSSNVNLSANQLYFCLPPTYPSSYRSYAPVSFHGRQKDIVHSNLSSSVTSVNNNVTANSSGPSTGDEDEVVEIIDRQKIRHILTMSNSVISDPNSSILSSSSAGIINTSSTPHQHVLNSSFLYNSMKGNSETPARKAKIRTLV